MQIICFILSTMKLCFEYYSLFQTLSLVLVVASANCLAMKMDKGKIVVDNNSFSFTVSLFNTSHSVFFLRVFKFGKL